MDGLQGQGVPLEATAGISRRRFFGYLIAAPTLVAAADFSPEAAAALPTLQPVDYYDFTDLLTDAAAPTAQLIAIQVNADSSVSFAMPRAEVGQGITTAVAMTIADEMGLRLDQVKVQLADARPELVWNQLTGGSNSMHSLFTPVRIAAAIARGALLDAAVLLLGLPAADLGIVDGVISALGGLITLPIGSLAQLAAVTQTKAVPAVLKPASQFKLIGTPQGRIDAHDIVTGAKVFAMDLTVPGALPTMLCRAPTINASAQSVRNLATVKAMPGVTDVAIIPHGSNVAGGVAVRAQTFGQCIDAIRALDVVWGAGTVDGKSEAEVLADLKASELPLLPVSLGNSIDQTYTFHFRPGDPLETNCAVADVRRDRAEVWACLKSPVWCKEQLALDLGLPLNQVTVHVTQGGGSFGRHLFADAAFEAAAVSRAMGKPVKLMWHRTDNFRQGRVHPMCTSRVRVGWLGPNVLTYEQRHTSVASDFTHGFGELLSALGGKVPGVNGLGYAQAIFTLSQNVPYNFGAATQLLNEIYQYNTFNTSAVRNIYSPDVCTARELTVDRLASAMGQDPYHFRQGFIRDARLRAVLDRAASAGNWGRAMAPGTAQGIAVHMEYKGRAACLVEIDCTPQTVNRQIPSAYTGPRVTKVVYVVDVGLPINPLGLQAQMMGGIMDGIAQALSYSLHLQNGHFLEGSWDNAWYTRQWNTPPQLEVIVMPPTDSVPGGAGEFGVAATMAAVAAAYGRATGTMPTSFPINHDQPLGFTPLPTVPPIPQSPTDGLSKAY